MTLFLVCIGWVLAATVVAFLPMRYQYIPGIALLLAAPVLIWMISQQFGWVYVGLGLFAFVSMFRNPLRYFAKRAMGQRPEIPK